MQGYLATAVKSKGKVSHNRPNCH